MNENLTFDFFAQPKVISGLKALEAIALELEGYDAHVPLVLAYAAGGSRELKLLKSALKESAVSIGAVCMLDRKLSSSDIPEILETLSSYECDSIITIGSGMVQSAAKMINILHSCDTDMEHIHELPCPIPETLPSVAVLTENLDGREATNRLLIDEYRLSHDALYPDCIIIDERMMGTVPIQQISASANITLALLCESCREESLSPIVRGWIVPAFRFLGDYQNSIEKRDARLAHTNAGIYAQIAHSNTGYGPVTTLAEVFEISQFCTASEAVASILPYYVRHLHKNQRALMGSISSDIETITLQKAIDSLWTHEGQRALHEQIIAMLSSYAAKTPERGKQPMIESLIRQTDRLLAHDDHTELLQLITCMVDTSRTEIAAGGDL